MAGAQFGLLYYSYVPLFCLFFGAPPFPPQLGPQHRHHHDEVWKNGISYAVGLMRSIAYCRIRLVNRKTAIVAKMTLHVGIR